jgi:predicted DNA-binding antitoxin AbrB/MazE fold protein
MRFDKLEEWYQKDSSFFIKEFFFSSLFEDNLQILSLEKYNVLSVFFKIFNLLKKISLKAGFISKINVKMENMVDFVKSILTLSAGEDEETELKIKNDFSLLSLIKKSNMYLKDFPKTKQLELKFLNKFIYLLTNKSI